METWIIIVLCVTIVVLGFVIAKKNSRIKVEEKLKISAVDRLEHRLNQLKWYNDLFTSHAEYKVFSLPTVRTILTNLENEKNAEDRTLEEDERKKLREFFLELQGILFEKFIMGLPAEVESLSAIIEFDTKHLLSKFVTKRLEDRVMEIWKVYVEDAVRDADEVDYAFELVKGKTFFHYHISGVDSSISTGPWYEILQRKADAIATSNLRSRQDEMNEYMHEYGGEKLSAVLPYVIEIAERKHLSSNGKTLILSRLEPVIEKALKFVYMKANDSKYLAQKFAEFKEIQERLYPKAKATA